MKKTLFRAVFLLISLAIVFSISACGNGNPATSSSSPSSGAQPDASAPGSSAPQSSGTTQGDQEFDGEIYIGCATGITGAEPEIGMHVTNTVAMAADDINAAGGVLGKKLVVIVEDDSFTAEGGLLATQRLLARGDIVALMGYMKTVGVMSSIDLLNIPTLTTASSAAIYAADNPYLFRVFGADVVIGNAGANWMIDKFNPSKVFIICSTDDVGNGCADVYEEVCIDRGVAYVRDSLNPGDRDFTGQVMNAKNAGCDLCLMYMQPAEAVVLLRQFHELDLVIPTIGGQPTGSTSFLNQCDPAYSDGLYSFAGFDLSSAESYGLGPNDETLMSLYERYFERFGIYSDAPIGIYPLVWLLADAIERAGSTDPDAITEALWQTKDFPAFSRVLTTDYRRDMCHITYIYQVIDNAFKLLDSAEVPIEYRNGDHN